MIDFDKHLSVWVRGKQKFNNFIRSSVETLLEDLRHRGDPQKRYWARMDF